MTTPDAIQRIERMKTSLAYELPGAELDITALDLALSALHQPKAELYEEAPAPPLADEVQRLRRELGRLRHELRLSALHHSLNEDDHVNGWRLVRVGEVAPKQGGHGSWVETNHPAVIDCMGSVPQCAANGCQFRKTAGYRAGEGPVFELDAHGSLKRPSEPTTFRNMPIRSDPSYPRNTIGLESPDGTLSGAITNLEPPPLAPSERVAQAKVELITAINKHEMARIETEAGSYVNACEVDVHRAIDALILAVSQAQDARIAELEAARDGYKAAWENQVDLNCAFIAKDKLADAARLRPAWRKIETAPKDGTSVILGGFHRGKLLIDLDGYDQGDPIDEVPPHWPWRWHANAGCEQPTIWMPLPAPPSDPTPGEPVKST